MNNKAPENASAPVGTEGAKQNKKLTSNKRVKVNSSAVKSNSNGNRPKNPNPLRSLPEVGEPFNPYSLFVGVFIPLAILGLKNLSSSSKLVFACLVFHGGPNGQCYPKQKTIADKIGKSTKQVQRAIAELVRKKLIRQIKPTGIDRLKHYNSRYEFLMHPCFIDVPIRSGGGNNGPSRQDESVRSEADTEGSSQKKNYKKKEKSEKNDARLSERKSCPTTGRADTVSPVGITNPPLDSNKEKTEQGEEKRNTDSTYEESSKKFRPKKWNKDILEILNIFRDEFAKTYPGVRIPSLDDGKVIGHAKWMLNQTDVSTVVEAVKFAFELWDDDEDELMVKIGNKYGVCGIPKRPSMLGIKRLLEVMIEMSETPSDPVPDREVVFIEQPEIDEDEWEDKGYYEDYFGNDLRN